METLLKHDQVINLHHVRHHPERIDPAALLVCHSTRKYSSFEQQFTNKDNTIKKKVLQELNFCFYSPDEICYALLTSTLLKTLFAYLVNPENELENRKLTSTVIQQMLSEKVGQEHLLVLDRFPDLMHLLGSEIIEIKRNAFQSIEHFSLQKGYRQQLLKSGILVVIFDNLVEKNDNSVVKTACQILKNLLEEGGIPITCLSYFAHENLIVVCLNYPTETIWEALDCLALMSQCSRSKAEMVAAAVHPRMANLFTQHKYDPETVQRIFLILTNLGQIVSAKNFLVEVGFVKIVFGFLNQYEPNKDLFLNTILFLTTLAEHQKGREELLQHLDKIEPFCSELFYPDTYEYAQALMEVVKWTP